MLAILLWGHTQLFTDRLFIHRFPKDGSISLRATDSKKYVQYEATSFSLTNAWWLAEVSTLVYADEEFVRTRLKGAGLPIVKFFDGPSIQCYVANNDKYAIVAFRGSEIWKKRKKLDLAEVFADLKADVDIRLAVRPTREKFFRRICSGSLQGSRAVAIRRSSVE